MNNQDNSSGCLFPLILIFGIMYFINWLFEISSPFNIFSETVEVETYHIYKSINSSQSEYYINVFIVNKDNQTVAIWHKNGSKNLKNCVVKNAHNWQCIYDTIPYAMIDKEIQGFWGHDQVSRFD
ncbi:hypothetical protein CW740_09510 [Kangiella profundi]|uniref:Uncharacterized protein n=1 Tax=Kangiella profundi TaxID=1561924 RepID=A0A2K9ASR8_9GAMM|nr:hypothetical protein [Kangiella profundi]AUD79463.1 hypothetical protein CW740_09510 [Kangiella profundi]GGE98257.1 hypothetical protein GCM10011356_10090 [Kangiella profundi]